MLEVSRQGDIFFIRMPQAEVDGKTVKRQRGRVVIAEGEVTGHAHAVLDKGVALKERAELIAAWEDALCDMDFDVDYVKTQPVRWLESDTPFEVVHEEHDAITFEPGQVLVIHQREYSPGEIRRVLD